AVELPRVGLAGEQQEDGADDFRLLLFPGQSQAGQPRAEPDRVQLHEPAPGVAVDRLLAQPLEQTRRRLVGHRVLPRSGLVLDDYWPAGARRQLVPPPRRGGPESPCSGGALWYAWAVPDAPRQGGKSPWRTGGTCARRRSWPTARSTSAKSTSSARNSSPT